jgi:hypothetical protein
MFNDPLLEGLANGSGWNPFLGFFNWANGKPSGGPSPTPAPRPSVGSNPGSQIQQNPSPAPGNNDGTPQQAPANARPAGQNGLDLDQLAGYAKTFGTHAAKAAVAGFLGAVVIGGLLGLAASAGPVAGGVALAAGVILLGAFLYELWTQGKEIYTGQGRDGATLSADDRAGIAGDALGGAVGAFLGGKSLSFLGKAFSPKAREATPGSQDCTGPKCFPAGTLVATDDGPKAIERIAANDQVWAYDLETQTWRLCRVIKSLDRFHPGDYVSIDLEMETIESTGGHPFWVVAGEGLADRPEPDHVDALEPAAKTPGQWVDARDLRAGDLLLQRSGDLVKIKAVRPYVQCLQVYNLHVAELQSYAVGFSQVLTHNYPDEGVPGAGAEVAPRASTLKPGPYAKESIPARGPARDFTAAERKQINQIGQENGCHTCGTPRPGTTSGDWVPDHQPPNQLNSSGGPQQLYPHCLTCSRSQGGTIRKMQLQGDLP